MKADTDPAVQALQQIIDVARGSTLYCNWCGARPDLDHRGDCPAATAMAALSVRDRLALAGTDRDELLRHCQEALAAVAVQRDSAEDALTRRGRASTDRVAALEKALEAANDDMGEESAQFGPQHAIRWRQGARWALARWEAALTPKEPTTEMCPVHTFVRLADCEVHAPKRSRPDE